MRKTRTTRRPLLMACGLALGTTFMVAWPGLSDEVAQAEAVLEVAEAVAEAELALDLAIEAEEEEPLDLLLQPPGFGLIEANDDLKKQMAQLGSFIAEEDWAKAFRLLTELDATQLQVMVPLGKDGLHVLVKEELQKQLLSLPPDGQRAFRLYFDAQANEQFEKIKNHPLPGSDEQLALAQALVDRLLASTVGGEAASLLGDMYFARGLFDQADRCWDLALAHGSATGEPALQLEAKRTLAMHRAGRSDDAQALFTSLEARYGQAQMRAGGEAVDAIAFLDQMIAPQDEVQQTNNKQALPENLLPAPDAMPHWHLAFLDRGARNAINQMHSGSIYYRPPADLVKFIPPVMADADRVYFQWLGVVFALDRQSGKILWKTGKVKETAQLATTRAQSNQGDPRNYRIAVSGDTVLVTTVRNNDTRSPFIVRALDAASGEIRWTSDTRSDWSLKEQEPDQPQEASTVVLGEVLAYEGWAYAVVCRAEARDLYLRKFDPATGEVDWTLPLGTAEAIAFQYTQVTRMPQPKLMMGPSLLYVMTNNGSLLAVDVIAGEMRWALRMDPPFGIGMPQQRGGFRGNQLGKQLTDMANTNGSGNLFIQDGTLYIKEHNNKKLYALDPSSGKVQWSAGSLMADAKLIGLDDKRFYLMDRALQSYHIDGDHDRIEKNGVQTGKPDDAGAILLEDRVLIYASGRLRELETEMLDPAGKHDNADYLGSKGGHLYVFGDLLIAVDTTQITAFKIQDNN